MESYEYYRATYSPVPPGASSPTLGSPGGASGPALQPALWAAAAPGAVGPGSPPWAAAGSPGATASPALLLRAPGGGSTAGWLGGASAQEEGEEGCGSPGGNEYYEYAADERFALEAPSSIQHLGWLLRASGKGLHRRWHKHWVRMEPGRGGRRPPGGWRARACVRTLVAGRVLGCMGQAGLALHAWQGSSICWQLRTPAFAHVHIRVCSHTSQYANTTKRWAFLYPYTGLPEGGPALLHSGPGRGRGRALRALGPHPAARAAPRLRPQNRHHRWEEPRAGGACSNRKAAAVHHRGVLEAHAAQRWRWQAGFPQS